MKKHLKSLLAALVIVCIFMSLIACGGTKTPDVKESTEAATTTTAKQEESVETKPGPETDVKFDFSVFTNYRGKTIKVWMWWDVSEVDKASDKRNFTDPLGITIEYTNIPWGEYPQKVISAIAAGAGPDAVWNDRGMPTWAYKKVLLPVSDYLDIKEQPLASELGVPMINYYTHVDGKVYSLGGATHAYRLYYNKEKFEAAGLEDPMDLWKAGEWTWTKFFEMGQALTVDNNGDGKVDQYGYDAWPLEQWLFTNSANLIKYVDGKPVFALDEPVALAALQAVRDIENKYKFKSPYNPDVDPQKKFIDGQTAMNYWGEWEYKNFKDKLGDKLGCVPFPIGPDYKGTGKSADLVQSTGLGIAACTQDPKLAAEYIKWVFWPGKLKDPESYEKWNKDRLDLYGSEENWDFWLKEIGGNAMINPVQGFGPEVNDLINQNILWKGDSTPAQLVEQAKPAIQAAIDNAISGK
jgi:multiple sugar transport system substrate-binding protein